MCSVAPSLKGVALKETVNITCRVDADPPDVNFYWTFNNSVRREQTEILESHRLVLFFKATVREKSKVFIIDPSVLKFGMFLFP